MSTSPSSTSCCPTTPQVSTTSPTTLPRKRRPPGKPPCAGTMRTRSSGLPKFERSRRPSHPLANRLLEGGDRLFVALVHGPALDALGPHQARRHQHTHVLAERGRGDAEFLSEQHAADAILDEVAVDLRPEVRPRIAQPAEDLQPAFVRQGLEGRLHSHI